MTDRQNLCTADGMLRTTAAPRPTTTKTTTTTTQAPTTIARVTKAPINTNLGVGMSSKTRQHSARYFGLTNIFNSHSFSVCTFEGVQKPNIPSRQSSSPAPEDRARDLGAYVSPKEQSNKPFCGFQQLTSQDQFDWRRNKGKTPSRLTGPTSDHTTKTGMLKLD